MDPTIRFVRLASCGPRAVGFQRGGDHYLLTEFCPPEFGDCLGASPRPDRIAALVSAVEARGW